MAMLVTGENIPLRESQDPTSKVLENISWDIVELSGGLMPDETAQKVHRIDGPVGYIDSGKLRSLIDYRLFASKREGKWTITALVAGD